jgi:hypothetical protein
VLRETGKSNYTNCDTNQFFRRTNLHSPGRMFGIGQDIPQKQVITITSSDSVPYLLTTRPWCRRLFLVRVGDYMSLHEVIST